MTQTKRYRSPALQSLHEVMEDLHEVGAIDKATMRDFDLGCLTPVEKLAPEAIKQIPRDGDGLSGMYRDAALKFVGLLS
jgi:DNA-binding transcriptional regulator YiaG